MDQPQTAQSGMGLNAVRQSEVSKELVRLESSVSALVSLSEELTQRLSSVISPKSDTVNKEVEDLNPSTPLGENLHTVGNKMRAVEKTLRFILDGLEL